MEFQIGDRVKTDNGFKGAVQDKLFSDRSRGYIYFVEDDDVGSYFEENELYPDEQESPTDYSFKVDIDDNRVYVRMYDADGNEISNAFGYVVYEGAAGIAQAMSYAAKRLLMNIGGRHILEKIGGDDNG